MIKLTKILFATLALTISFVACDNKQAADDADSDAAASEAHDSSAATVAPADTNLNGVTASPAAAKINLNTASDEELHAIPGLGDKMVHEFEEYRPYKSITQFRKEIGKYVDEAQVAEYEQHVFVPIDINESDAATLQQIPGLDASEAEQLIAGRPYTAKDAFMQKLSTMISHEEALTGASYLAH